jgi:dihydroorotate dehydrogenase (fumarate)
MPTDLTTSYLGIKLPNPVSACPLTGELDVLLHLEEAGAAAAVMPSLFEEQAKQALEMPQAPELAPQSFISFAAGTS